MWLYKAPNSRISQLWIYQVGISENILTFMKTKTIWRIYAKSMAILWLRFLGDTGNILLHVRSANVYHRNDDYWEEKVKQYQGPVITCVTKIDIMDRDTDAT